MRARGPLRRPAARDASRAIELLKVQAALAGGWPVQLVDVRYAWEVERGTLPGAVSLRSAAVEALHSSNPVCFVCDKGRRSMSPAKELAALGYPEVYNLTGGLEAWRRAGGAVVTRVPLALTKAPPRLGNGLKIPDDLLLPSRAFQPIDPIPPWELFDGNDADEPSPFPGDGADELAEPIFASDSPNCACDNTIGTS